MTTRTTTRIQQWSVAALALGATVLGALFIAGPADAIPAFARKEGQSCGFCHTAYPKLNEQGRSYKLNGYRFEGVKGTNLWDDPMSPFSMEVEIEGYLDKESGSEVQGGGKIDEIELMAAGNLSDRVAYFAQVAFNNDGQDYEFGPVVAQVNDLAGGQGELNAAAGQFEIGLPFFTEGRRVIRNKYLAFDKMDFMHTEFGGQVNGQILPGEDDKKGLTHRYSAGVTRGESDQPTVPRGFATYSATWNEVNNIGAIVVGGRNLNDIGNKYDTVGAGGVAQTECGKWTLTGAYFYEYQGSNTDSTGTGKQMFHNLMGEALFMPNDDWVLGGRIDWLIETERARSQNWGLRGSVLARYNVIWNMWLGAEYRGEDGGAGSPVTSSDFTHKGRLFAFMAF